MREIKKTKKMPGHRRNGRFFLKVKLPSIYAGHVHVKVKTKKEDTFIHAATTKNHSNKNSTVIELRILDTIFWYIFCVINLQIT